MHAPLDRALAAALGALALAAALGPSPAAGQGAAAGCHCFRDRTYDPARPAAADPYVLATSRSSLLSAAFAVPKAELVQGAMGGTAPEDAWVARWAGARAGRDAGALEVVCRQQVLVTDDKAGARDLFRSALTGYFATPVYNQYAAWYGFEEEAKLIAEGFRSGDRALTRQGMSDRLVDAVAIFGSLEECRERIAAYVAAGVDTTAISVLSFDPSVFAQVIEGFAPARA